MKSILYVLFLSLVALVFSDFVSAQTGTPSYDTPACNVYLAPCSKGPPDSCCQGLECGVSNGRYASGGNKCCVKIGDKVAAGQGYKDCCRPANFDPADSRCILPLGAVCYSSGQCATGLQCLMGADGKSKCMCKIAGQSCDNGTGDFCCGGKDACHEGICAGPGRVGDQKNPFCPTTAYIPTFTLSQWWCLGAHGLTNAYYPGDMCAKVANIARAGSPIGNACYSTKGNYCDFSFQCQYGNCDPVTNKCR